MTETQRVRQDQVNDSASSRDEFFRLARLAVNYRWRFMFTVAALCAATQLARAQTGIYGQVTALDLDHQSTNWQFGGRIGLYYELLKAPFLALSVDGRVDILGTGSNRTYSGVAGPRLSTKLPVIAIKPYLEALAGAVDVKYSPRNTQISATKLAYRAVGGLDVGVLPHVDWRAAEVSDEMQSVNSRKSLTFSTGIVIRIP